MRRDRAKAYRTIERLQVKIQASHRTVKRVQKRNERMGKRVSSLEEKINTPRSKAKRLIRGADNKKIKEQLTFHDSVLEDLKAKYGALRSDRQCQAMAKKFSKSFLKKYCYISKLKSTIGVSHKRYCATLKWSNVFVYECKPRSDKLLASTVHLVRLLPKRRQQFNNTWKKDIITRRKVKKQKRLLTDTVKNKKFISEHPDNKMSYFTFLRLQPFWVVTHKTSDRQTCKCRTHENIQLKSKLYELGELSVNEAEATLSIICCADSNAACMYRECDVCKHKRRSTQ